MLNIREYNIGQGWNGYRERTVRPSQFRAWSSPARIFSSNFYKNYWPYFENLRIPLDNAEHLQQLATLADEIISAKKAGEDTIELETKVNTLVYQLYGITDTEEIEVVEMR